MNRERTRAFLDVIRVQGSKRPELVPDKIPPGFWTIWQMSKRINLNERHASRYIRDLYAEGQLVVKNLRTRVSPICIRIVPHYKFKSRHAEKAFIKARLEC